MASQTTKLSIDAARAVEAPAPPAACAAQGRVPGVLYGGGEDPLAFAVDARELRHALAARGAVLELRSTATRRPAVLKDAQRHPVRGETMHVDFLRVDLDVADPRDVVPLELVGAEEAPGVREGGVLEHVTRELNIEALPTRHPRGRSSSTSPRMEINDTVPLSAVTAPEGVTLLDDLEETVVATLTPPRSTPRPRRRRSRRRPSSSARARRGRGRGRRRGRRRRARPTRATSSSE